MRKTSRGKLTFKFICCVLASLLMLGVVAPAVVADEDRDKELVIKSMDMLERVAELEKNEIEEVLGIVEDAVEYFYDTGNDVITSEQEGRLADVGLSKSEVEDVIDEMESIFVDDYDNFTDAVDNEKYTKLTGYMDDMRGVVSDEFTDLLGGRGLSLDELVEAAVEIYEAELVPDFLDLTSEQRDEVVEILEDVGIINDAPNEKGFTREFLREEFGISWYNFDKIVDYLEEEDKKATLADILDDFVPPDPPLPPPPPEPDPEVDDEIADVTDVAEVEEGLRPDGRTYIVYRVTDEAVDEALEDEEVREILVRAEDAFEQSVEVSGTSFKKLAERDGSLVFESERSSLRISAAAVVEQLPGLALGLGVDEEGVNVRVNVRDVEEDVQDELSKGAAEEDPDRRPVTGFVDIDVEAFFEEKTTKIESFGERYLQGEIPYRSFQVIGVEDLRKLNVYRFDEEEESWKYVRSKADPEREVVDFFTRDLSYFTVMEYDTTFDDIIDHWAQDYIELTASKHVVVGVGDNNYAPDREVTRAEFTAMLVRALDLYRVSPETPIFDDVAPEEWYYEAVETAYREGLVAGMDEDTFAPDEDITREQMAAMIVRAYEEVTGELLELSVDEIEGVLERFEDEEKVSNWAEEHVAKAVTAELLLGMPDDTFAPLDNSTRAQAATVFTRVMEQVELL